ncbi:MAG: alpha/beta hydrolase [candidate division Zixibacteria bacterium]|nr:alpha/beta hydrolase [candidate division Zixibacteria bacterium]
MAKMSQTVKEILQIVVFLLVVGILALVFIIYPLNRAKAILARPDIEEFNADSLPANDPTAFLELGAVVDTFRIDSDGLTNLACLYLTPAPDSTNPDQLVTINGTAILVHDERFDRTSMIPLAQALLDSGFTVCLYDQRASGLSTGTYHSNGEYEAADLGELISYLNMRDQIHHPFVVVGQALGADAAIFVATDEPRLDKVVAIEPYITSDRWLDMLMAEHDMYWIPFPHTLLKFWYELRSGYAPEYITLENLEGVECHTLILAKEDIRETEEFAALAELSGAGLIETAKSEQDPTAINNQIMMFIGTLNIEPEAITDDTATL